MSENKDNLKGCPCEEIDKEVEKLKKLKKELKKNKMCLYQRKVLKDEIEKKS
jgi:hypothetical protein